MPFQDIKTQLMPMLHSGLGFFDKDELFNRAITFMKELMTLDEADKTFLEKFFNKEYAPEILFDAETANRLKLHPVALRTLQMLK